MPTLRNLSTAPLFMDLRQEVSELFYGYGGEPGFSFTIIHRKVDKTQLSHQFDPLKREATDASDPKGGTIWPSTDHFVKTVKKKYVGKEESGAMGAFEYDTSLFFFEHTVDIGEEDSIIEILTNDIGDPVYPIKYLKRYSIKDAEPIRGNNGRTEFVQVYANKSE